MSTQRQENKTCRDRDKNDMQVQKQQRVVWPKKTRRHLLKDKSVTVIDAGETGYRRTM